MRHMRHDSLARELCLQRRLSVSSLPAQDLWRKREQPIPGSEIANIYGLLAHYTTSQKLTEMETTGIIGDRARGCWLTPTAYAACMVPYDLGLPTPRDICLLVDVSGVQFLWGPGTSPPFDKGPAIWQGGGLEFYCPGGVSIDMCRGRFRLSPCGDTHVLARGAL
jgi:hypothetical protein